MQYFQITKQTRHDSYVNNSFQNRKQQIMAVMDYETPQTARELAEKLGYSDLNAVKPRLTELHHADIIKPVTKKFDPKTGKSVAAYVLVERRNK